MGNESFLQDLVFNNHTSQKFTVSSSFTASKMRAQLFSQMLKKLKSFHKKHLNTFADFVLVIYFHYTQIIIIIINSRYHGLIWKVLRQEQDLREIYLWFRNGLTINVAIHDNHRTVSDIYSDNIVFTIW